jgi:ATP-binding cassette subfamily F protein 3
MLAIRDGCSATPAQVRMLRRDAAGRHAHRAARVILRGVNRRCWPASASASWAPTARASPPGQDHRAHAGAAGRQLTEGKGLSIGYFAQQELDVLRPQDTPLEHMMRLAREPASKTARPRAAGAAQLPGPFNFPGDMVGQPVGSSAAAKKRAWCWP